jgi:hypothetical protein
VTIHHILTNTNTKLHHMDPDHMRQHMETLYRITREKGCHPDYCYGPKVLRKLVIDGHGGSKVDEDGSDDGFLLRQGVETSL